MMKKLNKRHIFILTGVLALLVAGIIVLILLQKSDLFQFDYEVEAPIQDFNIVIDENTAIDGKRDEKFWNDNTLVFTEVKSGIKVTSWAHLGKNGLYLFTETDDTSVYWSKEKQFFENDSVEYYIDPRPEYSLQLDALKEDVKVRTDNIQVRVDTEGRSSTWFGRKTESGYPWAAGDFEVLTASVVDGEVNKKDGASGYGVETFIPWEAMGLETTPEEIGVMPAFNNVDNREDTSRTWFTVKGMNHGAPTSYARVDKEGFVQIAEGITLEKELTADWNDKAYKGESITLTEVNATNGNPETRGELKAFLGDEGVYFLVAVKDKVLSRYADGIWDNDGIEIVIDAQAKGGDNCFRDGVFRLAVDIDEGIETDICMTGYDDYVAVRRAAFSKTAVSEYKEKSAYDYKNTLVYEVMVPYSSMGLTKKPSQISFAWAVKTPNETSYILNRRNGIGEMEGQDWLWTNRHYPQNPNEYYLLTSKGLTADYTFPTWTVWDKCKVRSQAPTRYDYRGYAADDGFYLNMVQYVDKIKYGGVSGKWKDITHIEMELWNGDVGYGWDGTYLAFFPDGSHYINSLVNVTGVEYKCTITDRGAGYKGGFRYELSYEIYIGFENNKANPQDGPYAFVQMMSCTPGESKTGYENSIQVVKDGDRKLWTDDCNSYEFREDGIVAMENAEEYTFPAWTAWKNCKIRSQAPTRYDYRGYAADDGVYINMVQYVDKLASGGVSGTWKDITHIEMELWNGDVGYGWDGTYLAFFPDGSHYINSMTNVTALEYKCTITDRGEDYAKGYRYMLSYEVYLGFENNLANPQDGPYAFVQMMSMTPGESNKGYEKSITVVKDGDRKLWADDCKSYEFRKNGIVAIDTGESEEPEKPQETYIFPEWTAWEKCKVRSDAQTRYDYRGYAADDGVYINMVQYVDKVATGGVSGTWKDITHIEMELWNGDVGYGWDGTYLAFFPDGTYYINSELNVTALKYKCTVTDRGANYKEGYRYMLSYEIYLGFENNVENPQDGPYAFVQMMSITPGETSKGYEKSIQIVKDGDRTLWADDCKSYEFREAGIVAKDTGEEPEAPTEPEKPVEPSYEFPEWTAWEDLTVRSDVPARYDYRGFAADDGLYLDVVQYVDSVKQGGVADSWKDITHIEMELWNGDVGYGWDGTYLAFFPDGSHYINSDLNVTALEYQCTVTDRGANYADGYRYELSYEIYLGFENNLANPQDGPYAFVQFMSHTPGEIEEGYEKAETITKDGDRKLWTEESKSVEFRESGAVRKDSVYDISAYEDKIAQYKKDWEEKGNDGKTTLFIGDSFFDGEFWSTFYDLYWNKDVLRCGVSSSTSYDWEVFTTEFLKDTNPKNIVMHIGTNNIYDDNKDAEVTVKALQRMFSYMHETLPTTNLYYFGISLRTYDEAKIAITKEVNAAMEEWCAEKDYTTFIGGTVERLTGDMLRDNVHPREDSECNAYEIFVEELAKTDIEMESIFPAWADCTVRSKAATRYDYRGYAADDGVYINMVQYVDSYVDGGTSGVWKDITHVEMELFNHGVGYGWDGTYLAFFPDGSYYDNSQDTNRPLNVKYACTVTDRGADYTEGYRYEFSYDIYLGFENNLENPQDGPYAFVQMMSHTPGETEEGYDKSITVVKDGDRFLWADNYSSYEFRKDGIVARAEAGYEFPAWTAWEDCTMRSKAQSRYDYRGYAADDGLYINMVQYVDSIVYGGTDGAWKDLTHVEMEMWQEDVGNGMSGTYLAFFPNGSYYINNPANITTTQYQCTITDRGADYEDGYRYMLSYRIYLGFANNTANPQDGPYAFVQMMSHTPGESNEGYEKSITITKDGDRNLWTDKCKSYEFRKAGIVDRDDTPTFAFPGVADFTTINADLQSVDPGLYNFQMWTTDNGLYTYFVQKVPTVTLDKSDNWQNTHVEMELWNWDVGYGMDGTYIALFPDESIYINSESRVKSKSLHVNINELASGETEIEYYFYLEFDNNLASSDPSYAYVKQYQFLPGVSTNGLNSQVITRDGRQLLTGTEKSFQVHTTIDAKMYN